MKEFFLFVCVFGFVEHSCAWSRSLDIGPFSLALQVMIRKCEHNRSLDLNVSGIDVYFYNFPKNDVKQFTIDEAADNILSYKDLNRKNKFIFFVGGYKSHINKKTVDQIRDTFRNFTNSYLIIFDHSPYTNDRQGTFKSYERSVKYVHDIGKSVANMLTVLYQGGISPKNMHCIGHSLGSQILGHVGEVFFNNTNKKIARITGLDPAGPCYSNSLVQDQLRSGLADYVEVYHCNAGVLGTSSVLADIDFFVNDGKSQPHCRNRWIPYFFDSSTAAKCSHRACTELWTATVHNPQKFLAYKCDSYDLFKKESCSQNPVTNAGFWTPGDDKGVYFFSTEGYP